MLENQAERLQIIFNKYQALRMIAGSDGKAVFTFVKNFIKPRRKTSAFRPGRTSRLFITGIE